MADRPSDYSGVMDLEVAADPVVESDLVTAHTYDGWLRGFALRTPRFPKLSADPKQFEILQKVADSLPLIERVVRFGEHGASFGALLAHSEADHEITCRKVEVAFAHEVSEDGSPWYKTLRGDLVRRIQWVPLPVPARLSTPPDFKRTNYPTYGRLIDVVEGELLKEYRELTPPPKTLRVSDYAEWVRAALQSVDEGDPVGLLTLVPDEVDDAAAEQGGRHMLVAQISVTALEIERRREELDELVALARASNIGWKAIGSAVGISMQSAHRRWSPDAKAKHAERERQRRNG